MKKGLLIAIVLLIISTLIFIGIKHDIPQQLFYKAADRFFIGLERSRMEEYAVNREIEIIEWHNDYYFSISKYRNDVFLTLWFDTPSDKLDNSDMKKILMGVSGYEKVKDKFYVIAEEGYAVIDKNNICRAFIIEECESYRRDKYIEDDLVIYLKTKDDFSKEERAIFDKMEK